MKRFYKITALLMCCILTLGTGLGLFAVPAEAAGKWVASWGTSLVNGSVSVAGLSFSDVILGGSTLRTELTVTTGGTALQFVFSNQYGAADVTINEMSVAKTDTRTRAAIIDGTQKAITFDGGSASVTIPAGERVVSDTIEFTTQALETISISTYFSDFTYMTSVGLSNGRTFMRSSLRNASQVNNTSMFGASEVNIGSGAITYHTIPFLERINTLSSDDKACAAVFIGDSTLVNDTYLYYAKRIVSAGVKNISVVNEAIIGNKLLSDGSGIIGNLYGQALIDRFHRDVLEIKGVKYCFVKIGLNDILHQFSKTMGDSTPHHSANDIIAGYRTLIAQCHRNNIKIYFFTKSAWMGYERNFLGSGVDITWTQEEQDMCDALTNWVLTNKEADGCIDCSPLADPSDPRQLCPSFTPDGAHLTDLGSIALADLIPLEYVGVKSSSGKTAAQIAGKDPYEEKRAILQAMEDAKTTVPAEEPTTNRQEESTTSVMPSIPSTTAQTPTVPSTRSGGTVTTAPSVSVSQYTQTYTPPESYYYNTTANQNQEVTYNVVNDGTQVSSVGSGSSVGLTLVFVLVAVIAAAMVILTLMKKKENL